MLLAVRQWIVRQSQLSNYGEYGTKRAWSKPRNSLLTSSVVLLTTMTPNHSGNLWDLKEATTMVSHPRKTNGCLYSVSQSKADILNRQFFQSLLERIQKRAKVKCGMRKICDGYFAEWWCRIGLVLGLALVSHHSAKYPSQIFRIPHFTIARFSAFRIIPLSYKSNCFAVINGRLC